jgi:hypothetical protein
MSTMKPYWELEEALGLIRSLQPETRKFNYHLCLGGGVLNKGESKKDLDLYFLPMNNGEKVGTPNELVAWLDGLWGRGESLLGSIDYPDVVRSWKEDGYLHKLKYNYCDLRIDVFVIGVEK